MDQFCILIILLFVILKNILQLIRFFSYCQISLKSHEVAVNNASIIIIQCHGNVQTFISYSPISGGSIWTLARHLMARWHELWVQMEHVSGCETNGTFYFCNCGNICHLSIYAVTCVQRTPTTESTVGELNDRDQNYLDKIVCCNWQVTLVKIISMFKAEGTRHISSRSVQCFFASMGYRNRRPTKVSLLTPWC